MVRRRKRKRIAGIERQPKVTALAPNQSWSMDFVSDGFVDGRRLRCMNIVDDFTKECLAIEVDTSLPGRRVVVVLERLAESRGLPRSVTVDNGPDAREVIAAWRQEYNEERPHSSLGYLTPNRFADSFLTANSTLVSD
jgi:putative transposase